MADHEDDGPTTQTWARIALPVRIVREYSKGRAEVFETEPEMQALHGFPPHFPMHILTNWRMYHSQPKPGVSDDNEASLISQIWTEHLGPSNEQRQDRVTLHGTDIGVNISSVVSADFSGNFLYRHDTLRATVTRKNNPGNSYDLYIPEESCIAEPGSKVLSRILSKPLRVRAQADDTFPYAFGWGEAGDGEARSKGDMVEEWKPAEWREAYVKYHIGEEAKTELTLLVPARQGA